MNIFRYPALICLLLTQLLCTCAPSPKPDARAETPATMTYASPSFDWQGHRGCRGLRPENTIPAFLHALSFPAVTTLELDVVISKDDVVIVSHEAWMNPVICRGPAGDTLGDEKISLRDLTAAEIATYDCGQLPHPRFPEQQKRPATKPTLLAVFAAVEDYCRQHERPLPGYNIELKYEAELEPAFVPDRETFVDLVLADLTTYAHPESITLQCFDPHTLAIIHHKSPNIQLAYLDEFPGQLAIKMGAIGFTPDIYSPDESKLDTAIMREAAALNVAVIPWTVNETARMRELIDLGVAGIITDYPDRIPAAE